MKLTAKFSWTVHVFVTKAFSENPQNVAQVVAEKAASRVLHADGEP